MAVILMTNTGALLEGQWGGQLLTQILPEKKAVPGSSGGLDYYLPTLLRPCNILHKGSEANPSIQNKNAECRLNPCTKK